MIAYHDKTNNLKYILEIDRLKIEKEEIINIQLNENNLSIDEEIETHFIGEILLSEIESIYLDRVSSPRKKVLYHCNIECGEDKSYTITYEAGGLLSFKISNKKEFVNFLTSFHSTLHKKNKNVIYSKGDWFDLGVEIASIVFFTLLLLFIFPEEMGYFRYGLIVFLLSPIVSIRQMIYSYPSNYNPDDLGFLLPRG